MMKVCVLFLFLLTAVCVGAQRLYSDLGGYRLGQYREVVTNDLGKPFISGRFDDGFEYEAFLLKPDTSAYMIFEYSSEAQGVIWSIQVSGSDPEISTGIEDIRLGMEKSMLERKFGKPSEREEVGEYGQRWDYYNTNISFEINRKGKLASVKIIDSAAEHFSTPDLGKVPSLDRLVEMLGNTDRSAVSELLAPDLEIYYQGNARYFLHALAWEIRTDQSGVFTLLRILAEDLKTVDTNDPDQYEENMRVQLGADTKHVMKIKKGHLVKEIVLRYYWGRYVIWEIKT